MNQTHCNTKENFKHLLFAHYQYIQSELNHFIASGKSNKIAFINQFANFLGTTVGNLYKIIKAGTVTFLDAVCNYVLENPNIRSIDESVTVIAPTFDGVTVYTKTIYN